MSAADVKKNAQDRMTKSLETLRGSKLPLLPVLKDGRLAGLLTSENVLEAIMFRRALSRRLPPPVPQPA
jgi:CBS domain-containing protein